MRKDLFDMTLDKENTKSQRDLYVKNIVDTFLVEEEVSKDQLIDTLLPKVSYSTEGADVFLVKTLSSYNAFFSNFVYQFIHSEIEAIEGLEIESFSFFPFRFFELDTKKYLVTETVIVIKNQENRKVLHKQIKGLLKQLRLGLTSFFYARMVMEMKNSSMQGKSANIQERIMQYIHRFPKRYDYELIPMMNEFIKETNEAFMKDRLVRDLARAIVTFYIFSKKINRKKRYRSLSRRKIYVKARISPIEELFGRKKVISLMIVISYLNENERIGKENIIKACRKLMPKALVVENSYRKIFKEGDKGVLIYLEVEKKDGEVTSKDKEYLQEGLSRYLDVYIQKFARKVFMPQNTEEVMKYTVALSKELRKKQDYPQVAVLFESQTNDRLIFTAIIVRATGENSLSAFEIFPNHEEKKYLYKIKQVRTLGEFKEGIEVSYHLKISSYMREDYSIDIYRARAKVIHDLQTRFGIIRDYNGGMLEKQEHLLSESHLLLRRKGIKNSVLIDNFFYAIKPEEMRAIIDKAVFLSFFESFYDLFTQKNVKDSFLEVEEEKITFLTKVKTDKKKELFLQQIRLLNRSCGEIIYFNLRIQDKFYIGAVSLGIEERWRKTFIEKMSLCFKL